MHAILTRLLLFCGLQSSNQVAPPLSLPPQAEPPSILASSVSNTSATTHSASTTQHVPMEISEEELQLQIHREPGMGLGISIAGGKGSTPYRGDDEVGRYPRMPTHLLEILQIHKRLCRVNFANLQEIDFKVF